jgi:hypothetical protein
MKPINATRSTNKFCITSGHLYAFKKIGEKFPKGLVAVAYDDADDEYTVRVAEDERLVDYRLNLIACGMIAVAEEQVVAKFSKYASL